MQIVINIPEEELLMIKAAEVSENSGYLQSLILNGIPLPKGHGRLIDVDKIVYEEECIYASDGCSTTISIANIDSTPTIIEADK